MRIMMTKRPVMLAFTILAASLLGCSSETPSESTVTPVAKAATLKVALSEVPVRYETSGSITSDHRVSISSRLSGFIHELSVREGGRVTVGQVLVRVDAVDAKQGLIQASADLANAEADVQRYNELLKAGAVTTQQAASVQLRYKVAKSQVEQARNQLSYAEVRSPVNGVVVEKRLSQGDLAAPGLTILTLEDPASLLVETYVSEQFISAIKEGAHVDVDLPSLKQTFPGVVRQVVQAADPVSHQFLVKIALPAADGLYPGMYAQTGFHVGSRQALLIPLFSTISRSGLDAVYVLDEQSIAHYRQVRLGQVTGDQIEVLAGLHDGDVIAWNGTPALKSGTRVAPSGQAQ